MTDVEDMGLFSIVVGPDFSGDVSTTREALDG
ncbi:hypothetical protein IWX65_003578 [Arthrobacter sp. CAN_A214]